MKYRYDIDKKDKRKRRIALLLEMLCGDSVFSFFSFFARMFHAQARSHVHAPAVSYLIISTERFKKASRAAPFNMPF